MSFINVGEIFYSKKIKNSPMEPAVEIEVPGHIIGIAVGNVPPNLPRPAVEDLQILLIESGLFSVEDVFQVFGKDGIERLRKYYEKKYNCPVTMQRLEK